MQHFNVRFLPDDRTVKVHSGATLLEAAGQAGIILSSPCGGAGRCGKCRVQILPSGNDALACQYRIEHDVEVHIPEQSRFLRQQILQHGIGRDVPLDPIVRKVFIPDAPASAGALCQAIADIESVAPQIEAPAECDLQALLDAPPTQEGITAVLIAADAPWHSDASPPARYRLAAVEPGDTTGDLYGAAVDIGTTTVVVNLVDLKTGQTVATAAAGNPQARYGADVISRIQYATTPENAAVLQQAILTQLDALIGQAAQTAGIERRTIYEVVAAGNTTMNHLLLKLPVAPLGQAPYHAYSLSAFDRPAAEMALHICPHGQLHTIENIAGFVGSDTVAAALAGSLDIQDGATLLVDIGTNGELVLRVGDRLWSASCAAGPALEGAGIAFGSPAQDGAIQRVLLNDTDIDIDIIGDTTAQSLCGSGLIDAVAVLLDLGIVEETGRFAERETIFPPLPKPIAARLTKYNGQPAFRFSAPDAAAPVVLTQKDIRQFQLAKAAIRAGIQLLCEQAELPEDKLERILLAGAFGNYIKRESALRVGLLPGPDVERIRFVGNAAGAGATMILVSRHARHLAAQLARRIQYIEIAHQTTFQEAFSLCLLFPEKH